MSTRSILVAILFGAVLPTAVLAWTDPSAAPPGGGIAPPVNTSAINQDKAGPLTLGSATVFGNMQIYPPNPNQLNGYINWGTTAGTNGYGFRSAAGTLQYKNSGGSWTPIVAGSSGPTTFKQYGFYNNPTWNFCLIPGVAAAGVLCEQVGASSASDPSSQNELCVMYPMYCDFICTQFPQSCIEADDSGTAPNQWVSETGQSGHSMIYKELPDQTSTSWSFCSMNGYTTPYDHQTRLYVVKKNDTKWYVYYYSASSKYSISTIVNCWR